MTERKNPLYLYYTTVNDSYIPQMRAAGTNLEEKMPYGKGAYLSVSPNAQMGVDYTLGQEADWKEQDCVRLGNEYYTMDKFAEYIASVIKTDNIELVKKTLELVRQKYMGEMANDVNYYEKLGIVPYTYVHKEPQRVVDAIVFSYGKNFNPSATQDKLTGYTFEPRDVLSGNLQTFRVDAKSLPFTRQVGEKSKLCDGVQTLKSQDCLRGYSAVGSFLTIYGIGDVDRADAHVFDDQEAFIDKASEFVELISRPSAISKNIDASQVSDTFKHTVDMVQEHIKYEPKDNEELNKRLVEYHALLVQRKMQRKKHKEYYDLVRQGVPISADLRKGLPTIPEMKNVRERLLNLSKALVTEYIEGMPLADVYRAMTENVADKDLPQRIEKIREVYGFEAFEVPVVTQDRSKPDDQQMKIMDYSTDGKAKPQPNKAMEIQLVVLNPEIIVPTHRMGVDTKGKWEPIESADKHKTVSRTSVTRFPKKMLAGIDGMEIFQPRMQQGEMRLVANEEALNKLSSREQIVLGHLMEMYRVDFENIGTKDEPICALKKDSVDNFHSAMRVIRRAKLESQNLPRGVVAQSLANTGR